LNIIAKLLFGAALVILGIVHAAHTALTRKRLTREQLRGDREDVIKFLFAASLVILGLVLFFALVVIIS